MKFKIKHYIIYVNVINLYYLIFITIKIKNSKIFYSILLLLYFEKGNKNLLLIFRCDYRNILII